MTTKEKASELYQKFAALTFDNGGHEIDANQIGKQAALIAVDEILDAISDFAYSGNMCDMRVDKPGSRGYGEYLDAESYWLQVKAEIEKI